MKCFQSLALLLMTCPLFLFAQEGVIQLENPSFEDMPRHSRAPRMWVNCGFPDESPPDVQPDFTFLVSKAAFNGNTYLGMVTRDNDTWESVGQLLSTPLAGSTCYEFSIKLARSLSYYSTSRTTSREANYIQPIKLRVWGGFGMCDKRELLGESPLVENPDWQEFQMKLEPSSNYTHIILEAFYQTPSLFPYNGNLLLDDSSPFRPIPCGKELFTGPLDPTTQDPIAMVEPDPTVSPVRPVTPKGGTRSEPTGIGTVVDEGPKTIFGVSQEDLVAGLTIPIENVEFKVNSSEIESVTTEYLDALEAFLRQNRNVIVEIGGHSNGLADKVFADQVSTDRAKAVVDYLKEQGIPPVQLRHKGYGKRFPIASNETPEGLRKNQRVEVKILAIIKD